jgi:hypothetical protein
MAGLLFLLSIFAFALLILWYIQNDAPGLGGGEKGLFAMRADKENGEKQKPRWGRKR